MATARYSSTEAQPKLKRGLQLDKPMFALAGIARNERVEYFEDFLGDAGQTLPPPMVATKTGTSTNNTVDYAAGSGGTYALTHSADSEAQTMRLDCGDSLLFNMSKAPRLECRLKLNMAGAAMSADQRVVVGFASAYNATLDSVVTNAWFRLEGAVLDIFTESDDATTDDDDNNTGVDFVDDTYLVLEIDTADLSAVGFYVDGVLVSELDMSTLGADTLVQPIVAIQRDAGTEQEVLTVDYIHVIQER
ncbi:MAG: hypothetical protein GY925_26360 [Actinomycetia bacterium]|nr:hypothetical protein [Actinomycetes bacterium]